MLNAQGVHVTRTVNAYRTPTQIPPGLSNVLISNSQAATQEEACTYLDSCWGLKKSFMKFGNITLKSLEKDLNYDNSALKIVLFKTSLFYGAPKGPLNKKKKLFK